MTWKDIKDRKEDSIRESTNNPMNNPLEVNGKTYSSFSEYLDSKEHAEFLKLEEESLELYKQKAKEYFESLDTDSQHLVFFHITNSIYENYFKGNGSYRGLLYDRFGFGPETYSLGCDSGMFSVHNAISTPDELEDRFQKLIKHLNLNLTAKELRSAQNIFEYGFDNSKSLEERLIKQKEFDFEKDPE